LRLLYVAATRAQERLIVVGHGAEKLWDSTRTQFAPRPGESRRAPPLLSRLDAGSVLAWVLMASAAGELDRPDGDAAPLVAIETRAPLEITALAVRRERVSGSAAPELSPQEQAWVAEALRLMTFPLETSLSKRPAVLSVSAMKESLAGGAPQASGAPGAKLRRPALAGRVAPEGRESGAAVHRLLEHADLARLAAAEGVREQIAALVARGVLTAAQAGLIPVEDVAWFGGSAEGRWLAARAGACRREAPFVWGMPIGLVEDRVLVRGVIDCLVDEPEGLTLIDYKTDRLRDAETRRARLDLYRIQLQLYGLAAEALLQREVRRRVLVFLREREVIEVDEAPLLAGRLGGLA
jgi:ATP-dependent exoDNAse (exonuclease V) beta subunit